MEKDNSIAIAVVSYITILGWAVALVLFVHEKNAFTRVHLRQALLLNIIGLLIPVVGWIILLIGGVYGIYLAVNERKEEIPLIGSIAQKLFGAI